MSKATFMILALIWIVSCTSQSKRADQNATSPSSPIASITQADADLRQALSEALRVDDVFKSRDLLVRVQQGVVTLVGQAQDLRAKVRALELASSFYGVQSVKDRIRVQPFKIKSDTQIEVDVQRILALDAATELLQISADSVEGIVTLTGTVDSWNQSSLVEWIASGVAGVTFVNNRLHITTGLAVSDEQLKDGIRAQFFLDPLLEAEAYEVKVSQ